MNVSEPKTGSLPVYALYMYKKFVCHPNASLPKANQKQS